MEYPQNIYAEELNCYEQGSRFYYSEQEFLSRFSSLCYKELHILLLQRNNWPIDTSFP